MRLNYGVQRAAGARRDRPVPPQGPGVRLAAHRGPATLPDRHHAGLFLRRSSTRRCRPGSCRSSRNSKEDTAFRLLALGRVDPHPQDRAVGYAMPGACSPSLSAGPSPTTRATSTPSHCACCSARMIRRQRRCCDTSTSHWQVSPGAASSSACRRLCTGAIPIAGPRNRLDLPARAEPGAK